mmetsp:Transcript_72666/g.235138  ORF Transcript_72666/g.235138 Transcript_72666/m.235138 type:complete len:314 (-) Transcript_72666:128-1069(-)
MAQRARTVMPASGLGSSRALRPALATPPAPASSATPAKRWRGSSGSSSPAAEAGRPRLRRWPLHLESFRRRVPRASPAWGPQLQAGPWRATRGHRLAGTSVRGGQHRCFRGLEKLGNRARRLVATQGQGLRRPLRPGQAAAMRRRRPAAEGIVASDSVPTDGAGAAPPRDSPAASSRPLHSAGTPEAVVWATCTAPAVAAAARGAFEAGGCRRHGQCSCCSEAALMTSEAGTGRHVGCHARAFPGWPRRPPTGGCLPGRSAGQLSRARAVRRMAAPGARWSPGLDSCEPRGELVQPVHGPGLASKTAPDVFIC